ncbi:MAG: HEAT repeat domain-containing protein [Thermodesulfovibrionales bacterium]|nr:HEAT repeat domain-containing protein [Thermodesulfovibrionales bacterium]
MKDQSITNPYDPFNFKSANFVGRTVLLQTLKKRLTPSTTAYINAKHCVILGDGGSGKTWLLLKFLSELTENKYHKIYMDIGNYIEDIEGFISDFQNQSHYVPKTQASFKQLMKSATIGFPIGFSINPSNYFVSDVPVAINQRLNNLSSYLIDLANKSDKLLVIILDQYGLISQIKGGAQIVRLFANLMRESKISHLSKLLVITALRPEHKGILEFPYGDEIFNPDFVDRFSIGCFSKQDAVQAIKQPIELIGKHYSTKMIDDILSQIKEPNPYYLQLSCRQLWDEVTKDEKRIPLTIHLSSKKIQEVLSKGQANTYNRFELSQKEVLKVFARSHPIPLSFKQLKQRLISLDLEDVSDNLRQTLNSLVNNAIRPLRYIDTSSAYRINHDLFAEYILKQHCASEEYDAAVLQGFLEYLPGLYRISQFNLDENLLNRLWTFHHLLRFSDNVFEIIAYSILGLDKDKMEVHFQWFNSFGSKFANALKHLLLSSTEENVRLGAIIGISKTRNVQSWNVLVQFLNDESSTIRKASVEALGELKSEEACNALISSLVDEESDVRQAAAEALGKIKLEKALPFLGKMLLRDQNVYVIRTAVKSIIEIGGVKAHELIVKIIKSGPKYTRINSIFQIVKTSHQDTGSILVNQMRTKDEKIVLAAIKSIGELKDQKTFSSLAKRIFSKSPNIAEAAIRALAKTKTSEANKYLIKALYHPNPNLRLLAFHLLKSNLMHKEESLIKFRKNDPIWTKKFKARLLCKIGTKMAFQQLLILSNDLDEVVRAQWAMSLSAFKTELNISYLEKAFHDSSPLVRKAAVNIASTFANQFVKNEIEILQSDPNRTVKWLAQRFLTQTKKSKKSISSPQLSVNSSSKANHNINNLLKKTIYHPSVNNLPVGPLSALLNDDKTIRECALILWHFRPTNEEKQNNSTRQNKISLITNYEIPSSIIFDNKIPVEFRVIAIRELSNYTALKEDSLRILMKCLDEEQCSIRSAAIHKLSQEHQRLVYEKMIIKLSSQKGIHQLWNLLDLEKVYSVFEGEKKKYLSYFGKDGDDQGFCKDIVFKEIQRLRQSMLSDKQFSSLLLI